MVTSALYNSDLTGITSTSSVNTDSSTVDITISQNNTQYNVTYTGRLSNSPLISNKLTKKDIDKIKAVRNLTNGWSNPKKVLISNKPKSFNMKKVIRNRLRCNKNEEDGLCHQVRR